MAGSDAPLVAFPDRGRRGAIVRVALAGDTVAAITRVDVLGGGVSSTLAPATSAQPPMLVLAIASDASLGWRDAYVWRNEAIDRSPDLFEVLELGSGGWAGIRGIGAHLL
jgi:hypothetical protein